MIFNIIAAIFILGGIIFIHETGHFLVARKMGVEVKEFALGFGPKMTSRKLGQTEYSLRLIPLGGFISMAKKDSKETGESEPVMQRFAITVAGPLMNFALGLVLFTVVFFVLEGVPTPLAQVGQVSGRASEAGLQTSDVIIMVNTEPVQNWRHADELVWSGLEISQEEVIEITVNRNGEKLNFPILPEKDSRGLRCIGIEQKLIRFRLLPSIFEGARMTGLIIWVSHIGLIEILAGIGRAEDVMADIAGPVGLVGMVAAAGYQIAQDQIGIIYLLGFAAFFAAFLSIGVGLFNLLPIPGLDGSHLIFSLIEVIRGRPDPKKEGFMLVIGGIMIFLLIIIITYRDIVRLFF